MKSMVLQGRAKIYINKKKSKVVVLASGGIDSTAAMVFYQKQNYKVSALHIDYGQNAARHEYKSIKSITKKLDVPLEKISCGNLKIKNEGEIKGRNAFFLLTALMKNSNDANIVALGIHSGTPYFDCGPSFLKSMQKIFDGYTGGAVQIGTPFIEWNKSNIVAFCRQENAPLNLTYSCELGKKQPCGKCPSCLELEKINVIA